MERLTFNTSVTRAGGSSVVSGRNRQARAAEPVAPPVEKTVGGFRRRMKRVRERYDSDYLWMLTFTALLFFRPQDQIPPLQVLHLSELTAIAGLAAMAVRRLGAGLSVAKVNTEVIGVMALGAVIVLTIPFSSWPGGSAHVFSDIYVKIILIFALMVSTLTTPKRLQQMTWLMIVASSYIAGRAVIDYVRGVNLVEGDRVRSAVGGMFQNPNDLALNLVTFLAPTIFIVIQDRRPSRRLLASFFAATMLAAIVCTKSRSGFLGLLAMCVVIGYYTLRARPGLLVGAVFAALLALPVMPQSFWNRMDSIMNAEEDQTGSREARLRLLTQGIEVFAENPLTGVGAGQFQNYNAPGETIEKWRVTHNVWLQVASELGIFGLLAFGFLVVRSFKACLATLAILKPPRRKRHGARQPRGALPARGAATEVSSLDEADRYILDTNAKSMLAAMVGWTVCSLFASVAFNWTFYYVFALAVAGREIAMARRAAAVIPARDAAAVGPLVRAHA
jgi:O-antigen ligase